MPTGSDIPVVPWAGPRDQPTAAMLQLTSATDQDVDLSLSI